MFETAVAVGICLMLLGAWFLLSIGVAETILTVIVLGATAMGIYWLWAGRLLSEIVEGVGIFAVLVIIFGSIRLGIEKLSDMLPPLLPPPFENKRKATASARDAQGESGEHHHSVLP